MKYYRKTILRKFNFIIPFMCSCESISTKYERRLRFFVYEYLYVKKINFTIIAKEKQLNIFKLEVYLSIG